MSEQRNEEQLDAKSLRERLDSWRQIADSGSFEEAMEALETIVTSLDGGSMSLELSIESFEVGASLVSRCSQLLEDARVRVSAVMDASDSTVAGNADDLPPELDGGGPDGE